MPVNIPCPKCSTNLKVPDHLLGKKVRCPRCQTGVATPPPAEEDIVVGVPVESEAIQATPPKKNPGPQPLFGPDDMETPRKKAAPEPLPGPDEAEPPRKKRKRKKKPASKGFGLPAIAIESSVIKLVGGLAALLLFGVLGFYGFRAAFRVPPPPDIPDSQWQPLEVAGRCKVLFPGPPTRQDQAVAGIRMVMHSFLPTKDSVYGIGYTEGVLPPHRRNLPAETLLNDSCDGTAANLANMGGQEVKRESIQLGQYPGKQLTIDIPRASGKMFSRCYLAGGRLYLAMCGGSGVELWQKNVKRFFDSFEILDDGSLPAGSPAPAGAPPQVVQQPPPPQPEPARPAVEVKQAPEPPQVATVELPPLPDPVPIQPPPIEEETTYKLPEPVRSLRVGGGGRFLVLHFPKDRKFGVFDANEATIVRYLPAAEDDALFAAGMTKLVVYLPGAKVVQRYNLLTGERERVGRLDLPDAKVEAFCMGHASAGPLLVGVAGHGAALYDIDRFREIPLPTPDQGALGGTRAPRRLEGGFYWAGATGRVFGHTGNYGQPNGVKTVVLGEGGVQQYGEHQGTWFVLPGPDDKHVYAGGHGVVSDRVKPVSNVPFSMGPNSGFASHLYLPAHHGPFYLHAQTIENFGGQGDNVPVGTVRVFMLGDKEPIAVYKKSAVCKYGWEALRGLGIEHSLHLIPKAKLLAIVPESRDELRLYPADLEAALDRSGRDYLVFTSSPPSTFEKGKAFTYQTDVRAKKGPATLRVEDGPKGMAVDDKGAVTWKVPEDFADKRVDVILAAKDAGGQEVFQTFALHDGGAK